MDDPLADPLLEAEPDRLGVGEPEEEVEPDAESTDDRVPAWLEVAPADAEEEEVDVGVEVAVPVGEGEPEGEADADSLPAADCD